VGVYGKSYFSGSRDAWDSLKRWDLESIATDAIFPGIFFLVSVFGAAVSGGVGVVIALFVGPELNPASLWWIGCLVGYTMVSIAMQVVDSAVTSVFIFFSEKPALMKREGFLDLFNLLKDVRNIYKVA
jgi:hypothetical protein